MLNLYIKLDPREQENSWLSDLKLPDNIKLCGIFIKDLNIYSIKFNNDNKNKSYLLILNIGEQLREFKLDTENLKDIYNVQVVYGGDGLDKIVNMEKRLFRIGNNGESISSLKEETIKITSNRKYELSNLRKSFTINNFSSYGFLGGDHWYGMIKMGMKLKQFQFRDRSLQHFEKAMILEPERLEPYYFYITTLHDKDSLQEQEKQKLRKLLQNVKYPVILKALQEARELVE